MAGVAEAIRRHLPPGTVVTDVASIKEETVAFLDPLCGEAGCRFVGGHPVAGSEETGAAARMQRFSRGAVHSHAHGATDPAALAEVRALWEGVGMRVEEMDAAMHDMILARVSHAPHLVAYALAGAVGEARVGAQHRIVLRPVPGSGTPLG